ncbi:aminotransferase class V-fold PLP-dependent enzyme, partial [Patescibacteria group bacterium]|nr:aminotransferase class V-fold PLP-dependent enzyme [Patescibacteria group bacterium]
MFSKRRTYLDWAASAPVSPEALSAFTQGALLCGNPSSPHTEGLEAHELLEDARTRIARLASVKKEAVIFTSGATESNALAIQGFVQKKIQEGAEPSELHILYLPTAHASTLGAVSFLQSMGVSCEELPVTEFGIDLEGSKKLLKKETVFVAVDLVCGETGVRYPVRDLKRLIDASDSSVHLHVDASQA